MIKISLRELIMRHSWFGVFVYGLNKAKTIL